jgi:hypothetical protein
MYLIEYAKGLDSLARAKTYTPPLVIDDLIIETFADNFFMYYYQ